MNKKKAAIEYLSSIMLICLTGILLIYCIRFKEIKLCQMKIRDCMDISALAAAVIDTDELYSTGMIRVNSVTNTRTLFEKTLKHNLNLDENMIPVEKSVYDKINIHKFIVYRIVNDEYIMKYEIDANHYCYSTRIPYDKTQRTPDGKLIEGETIYIDAGTYVEGLFSGKKYEHITSCVDIVSSDV